MNQESDSVFGEMTRYELLELTISIQSASNEAVAIFISGLSAYLVVAYLVGRKLTKFQLYSITLIYSAFMLNLLNQFIQMGSLQRNLVMFTAGIDNFVFYQIGNFVSVTAWLTSLAFMYRTRNSDDT